MDEIVLFGTKSECCGCAACFSVCPREAIAMREDSEGFPYPEIDRDKCVRCGRCLAVCPIRGRNQAIAREKQAPHIGILNLQNTMNYGASIAAIVLQEVVQGLAGEETRVVTLQYSPRYQGSRLGFIPYYVKMNNGWVNCVRGAFRRVFREDKGAMKRDRAVRKRRFQQFHARFMHPSAPYGSAGEMMDGTNWQALIVGSDVVWQPKRITTFQRDAYFFRLAENIRRIAYAASTDASNDVLKKHRDLYREGLKHVDRISVREKSNIGYLRTLTDKPIAHCCDPAFLYAPEQYADMLAASAFRSAEAERYIYVYLLDRNDFMADYAKKLAREKGMKLRFFATKYPELSEYGENCLADGPAEFLARLRYATYVLTNSFHCCVFSLMFHKQFLSFERGRTSIKSRDLLAEFGLLNRIVMGKSEKNIDDAIDFAGVDRVIERIKGESMAYLKEALDRG